MLLDPDAVESFTERKARWIRIREVDGCGASTGDVGADILPRGAGIRAVLNCVNSASSGGRLHPDSGGGNGYNSYPEEVPGVTGIGPSVNFLRIREAIAI